jgi:hypothetical protein
VFSTSRKQEDKIKLTDRLSQFKRATALVSPAPKPPDPAAALKNRHTVQYGTSGLLLFPAFIAWKQDCRPLTAAGKFRRTLLATASHIFGPQMVVHLSFQESLPHPMLPR